MNEDCAGPTAVGVDRFRTLVDRRPPPMLDSYRQNADLVEDFDVAEDRYDGGYFFVAVAVDRDWPSLVVTQRFFSPSGAGFDAGALLVPQTASVFIGAGTRLLGYQLGDHGWRRMWSDQAELGFLGWRQHGDVVLMEAELELAAWHVGGHKLWTRPVEPPWSYQVTDDLLQLDVMGVVTTFDKHEGPQRLPPG